jgi:hypothetical protein
MCAAGAARAQDGGVAPGRDAAAPADGGPKVVGEESQRAAGTVLTYYGLRKLELDAAVSDEEKLKEWQAFIERATDQIAYAKKAVERWKDAARIRVIEQVQNADRNPEIAAKEKIEGWSRLLELYPRSAEAKIAKKRIAHWRATETQRLVEAAEEVEKSRATKVDRVRAWQSVADWVQAGPEQRAAVKRIQALQTQLYAEAESLDRIPRVDAQTKIAVWRDVLAAAPSKEQRAMAERRIAELEAEVAKAQK